MVGAREVGYTLTYGMPANPAGPLHALVNDAGLTLLTFDHDYQYGFLQRVTDRFGRAVLYQFGAAAGTAELLAVSPVLLPSQLPADGSIPPFPSIPPVGFLWPRYQYSYERIENQPRLSQVTAPDPSGGVDPASGLPRRYATARIAYESASGFVTGRTDASGNTRAYSYLPPAGSPGTPGYTPPLCRVTVTDRAVCLAHQFMASVTDGFKAGGIVDAFGRASTIRYGDGANPYRPTRLVTALGRTTEIAWDGFGRLTGIGLPRTEMVSAVPGQPAAARHPEMHIAYDPATGRPAALEWRGPSGEPGPALGLLYGPADPNVPTDPESGMLTALVGPDARRLPALGNQEAPVTTTYRHTALGNIASVAAPAPQELGPYDTALKTVTTAFAYTTPPGGDPLDGYTRTREVFGEPLARTDPLGRLTRWR
jgi:YD repeat-containing protein